MKMTLKGLSAFITFWVAYIDTTFTPLFWVLLLLVVLDLVLSAHKEGQQFNKIGSMAISLGIPGYIISNFQHSDFQSLAKYIVAALCLVYLQIVVPALLDRIKSFKLSSNPVQNAADQEALQQRVQQVEALIEASASKELTAEQAKEKSFSPSVAPQQTPAGTEPQATQIIK